MNLFDVLDNMDLLPKAVQRLLALALLAGITYIPTVRHLYVDQARLRGEQISNIILRGMTPATRSPEQPAQHQDAR